MISIVITNHNGEENLRSNLPRVVNAAEKYTDEKVEIIIVDDFSSDKSASFIKDFCSDRFETCRPVISAENLGFAKSSNLGVENARGEIVVLLNSDVYPDENFLRFLIPHFQDTNVFAVGCLEKTIDKKGNQIGERGVGELFFRNGIYQHKAGDLNSKKTDWVCGGSGAFRRELFRKLGGFDKWFAPFYWEDIDLSLRAAKSGYKLLFEKKSIVYHQHVKGSIAKKFSPSEIEKISFKNQLKFTLKHLNSPGQMIGFILFLIKFGIRQCAKTK